MKIFKKIITALSSLAMIVAPIVSSGVVNAVKPAAPNTVIIKKQVKNITNSVNNTFSFQIEADGNNPATVTGVPTTFTIPFNHVAPDAGTKIAEQSYTLDFSNVDFPKVGDYYFKITEPTANWSTDTDNIYPRDTNVWWAYVSVRYELESDGVTPKTTMEATVSQDGYKGANGGDFINPDPTATPPVTGNKGPIIFETTPEMTYIEIEKKVTGNLGDITEYFEYTIQLPAIMASTATVTKSITVLDKNGNGFSTNGTADITGTSANVNIDTTGKIKIYLKHNQGVQVGLSAASNGVAQIPLKLNATTNNQYTVTETPKPADSTNSQYKYKIFIDTATAESSTGAVTKTLSPIPVNMANATAADTLAFKENNTTKYTNNKEADPITGFFINYWPFILLAGLGIMGIYVMRKTSKRK